MPGANDAEPHGSLLRGEQKISLALGAERFEGWPRVRISLLPAFHAPAATPKRPRPGSFSAGRRMSKPRTAPKKLSSKPSTQPTVRPRYPAMETNTPRSEGVTPNHRPSYGKSFPIAVGGSTAQSSGTASSAACTKVLELGP